MPNNTTDAEIRDILSKVLIDGQNQIHDLKDGRATPEEITERMFASLDYWTPKAQALLLRERIDELRRYGYPKELTKKGMDDFWRRTNELEAELSRLSGEGKAKE